jgi:rhodanese-related sulfurtransferase
MSELTIGVVGAAGRLGRLVVAALEADGAAVVAVDVRHASAVERANLLGAVDALVFTASVADTSLHREAVERGCHVVDVTVDRALNRELLALDKLARDRRRCVVAMAGCAPGLTGVLAADMLNEFAAAGERVVVALIQSPTGTAGEGGTREMLNMLTEPGVAYRGRPVQEATGAVVPIRLFDLRNAETEVSGLGTKLELATGFDPARAHWQLRALRGVRSIVPATYLRVRDPVARRKARTSGKREVTKLSAVAIDSEAKPMAGRLLTLASDYGATAAVAAAAATASAHGRLVPGAGHLLRFLTLGELLATPVVAATIDGDTGPVVAG